MCTTIEQKEIEDRLDLVLRNLNEDGNFQCVFIHNGNYRAVYLATWRVVGEVEPDSVDYDSDETYQDYTKEEALEVLRQRKYSDEFMQDLETSVHEACTSEYYPEWFNYMTNNEIMRVKEAMYALADESGWAQDSGEWDTWLGFSSFIGRLSKNY